jgi:class 3 adenylate cyclase/predicted ATPase
MEGITCTTCGAELVAAFRRCGTCGTPRPDAAASDEIRRFVTVVTSDLKGSTALGERLDPESLREVLSLYFEEMQAVFRSNGGTIEKIIGDAIVAVFGLPVRHDDDALRAVEAAAESQRVLAGLNDRLEAAWGVRLVVRTGVATGEVVFGEASLGQHVLTGDTMQASSAMEQNAPPLEVLIAGSTYDLVRDSVVVEAEEPVVIKGSGATVPAFRLVSVRPRPEAGQARADTAAAGLVLCPACGEENPERFRLCGMCGSTLATVAGFRESRKTVTIVFADPKPTTLDGARPSAEALRDVMSRYFEVMKAALEGHGGTVEKFIGDAVMAVFGLPVRHEDDAVRAVRGAAAMQAALPALNEQFRAEWGLELRNHIGVNSGEVIAGDASLGQRLVTGDAVNTAARLEQAAGAQEVILGDLTYRLARDQIEVEPIEPLTLKGKREPVPAYRLVRVAQRPAERAAPTTPFVGREEEMARLEETLLEVVATRSCQLVTVIGDAGVGKSRLIREFASRASERDRAQVLRGRCLPYGDGVTFWPIGEIVRAAADINDEDPRELALTKMAEIARDVRGRADDPEAIIERVAAAIGLSTTPLPGPELFWGIRKLLEAIASRRPLVAIVDDIHVAAPTFLELLDHLLDAVHGSPILLLTTARRELLEARTEWAEGHEAEQVVLEPLSAGDSEAIIEQLLGGLAAPVRRRIVAAAEGNPLYVEQITAMLVETGAIRRDGDAWIATVASGEIDIPPTVQALVAARLDALREEERQVIDPASVIGLGFAVEAVSHLVSPDVVPAVPERLNALTAKQFVRPTVAEADFYRFGHAVIKDTAYRSLLKRTRAELHERFVDWAEPVNRERGREIEFEEILGYHLEQAYRYRSELGAIDPAAHELGRRAAEKLAGAGRRALGRGDMPAAANLLGRAAALLPTNDEDRIALLPELAEALMEMGDLEQAGAVVEEASELATAVSIRRLAARASLVRLGIEMYASGFASGLDLAMADAKAAVATLEAAGDSAGLARAWRVIATIHAIGGRYEDSADAARQIIAHAAAVEDRRLIGRAAAGLASDLLRGPRPVEELLSVCQDLLAQVEGDRKAEAIISGVLAQLHAMRGSFDLARQLYRHGQTILSDLGQSLTASATSTESSRVEWLAGDLVAAEGELRRDDEALALVGEQYFRSTIAGLLAQVLVAVGKLDDAATYAAICEELAGSDDAWSQVLWRTARARVIAAGGDVEAAVRLASEAIDLADTTVDIELAADARVVLADVLEASLRPDEIEPPLREALQRYEAKGDVVLAERVRQRLQVTA